MYLNSWDLQKYLRKTKDQIDYLDTVFKRQGECTAIQSVGLSLVLMRRIKRNSNRTVQSTVLLPRAKLYMQWYTYPARVQA